MVNLKSYLLVTCESVVNNIGVICRRGSIQGFVNSLKIGERGDFRVVVVRLIGWLE